MIDAERARDSKSGETPQWPSPRTLWRRLWSSSATLGAAAALATMIGTVGATFVSWREKGVADVKVSDAVRQREMTNRIATELDNTRRQLDQLQVAYAAMQRTMESARKSGKTPQYAQLSPTDRQSLDQIKNDQAQLQTRLSGLETALMTTPEKALAVPMLKQQIDILQDRTHSDLDSIRGEIGRLFALTQWFIGLMFTIALGVFGLAISSLKRSKGKAAPDE